MTAETPITLLGLPNEIVLNILSTLRSTELLPLSSVSLRFHSLVLRLIYQRLSLAVNLRKHILLLECYPPSRRAFDPALPCTYLGTDGLDDRDVDTESLGLSPVEELRRLKSLCSRFRPRHLEAERRPSFKHPAGDVEGSRTYVPPESEAGPSNPRPRAATLPSDEEPEEKLVTQSIHLDSTEMFTQLCAQTSVAIPGLKASIYHDHIDINSGVIRVFRKWLAEQDGTRPARDSLEDVLWANDGEQVGVRFRVRQKSWRRNVPLLMSVGEDAPVSYEIQFEEVLIRTTHLLLKLESSLFDEKTVSARAIMYGNVR